MDPHTTRAPVPAKDAGAVYAQQPDTVARKSCHIGTGTPTTTGVTDAAHLADVPGSEPVEETEGARETTTHEPAALTAS